MAPTTNFFRASRPLFRSPFFTAGSGPQQFTNRMGGAFRARNAFRQNGGKRFQSSAAGAGAAETQQSWFKRMWDSPIGLKTVHFWAPVMKWALVLAGVSDFARPAEKLSVTQNVALTATGLIWTRWCLIIKPKNYLLAAVNFFLGIVGVVQVTRIVLYHQSQKSLPQKAEEVKDEAKEAIKS
ncbi:hypothetical protein VTK73DRAFT_2718 [Phialemonium thermophilum]|uniref:Mitochondrial pyruvate carrier n=1 Tax=Phialemonium thermophilum TaxID=223376 RepID=A0ABR3X3D6_9PEZI